MPIAVNAEVSIEYLRRFLTRNKARGMTAELALKHEIGIRGSVHQQKLLPGGWLISPKVEMPQHYRYLVCVMPFLHADTHELQTEIDRLQRDRGWQALAAFMSQSGIGVIVSGAVSVDTSLTLADVTWVNYVFQRETENLNRTSGNQPFASWPGNRGRAASGNEWDEDVSLRIANASSDDLAELALRQAFYYGYLKTVLKKPTEDPYDVDAFVVGNRGTVMPVEIKEKSITPHGEFGIDAGRILMLLRLCLATDSNALYLIREIDGSSTRNLNGWRCITLSDMIIGCRWNLQAGGTGMGGGATQTVMISGSRFHDFGLTNLSEDWLHEHRSLQESVRARAMDLAHNLSQYLQR